jgi:hypothetical protein
MGIQRGLVLSEIDACSITTRACELDALRLYFLSADGRREGSSRVGAAEGNRPSTKKRSGE